MHRSKAHATLRELGLVETLGRENLLDQRRLKGAQLGRADGRWLAVNDEDAPIR